MKVSSPANGGLLAGKTAQELPEQGNPEYWRALFEAGVAYCRPALQFPIGQRSLCKLAKANG